MVLLFFYMITIMKLKCLRYIKDIHFIFLCIVNPTINAGGVRIIISKIATNLNIAQIQPSQKLFHHHPRKYSQTK